MYRFVLGFGLAASVLLAGEAKAADNPAIRLSPMNQVPACVTPDRLMAYVKKRNPGLLPAFRDVAHYYQKHGEAVGVRWDYAFYQMIVETNWLKYKTGSGRPSDVAPSQNNFAGLGATGGGVPGERFADVSTGVLAHLQHIKMYSGEHIENAVAERTRKVQSWLISDWASKFDRPITYSDLTKKWSPSDSGYANDIKSIAERYLAAHCPEGPNAGRREEIASNNTGATAAGSTGAAKSTTTTTASTAGSTTRTTGGQSDSRRSTGTRVASASAAPVGPLCRVWTAEFSGAERAVLIRSASTSAVNYTALAVQGDLAGPQTDAFIRQHAQGGEKIGEFPDTSSALTKAFELCPQS